MIHFSRGKCIDSVAGWGTPLDGEAGDSSPSLPTERDASSTHERALAETSGTGTTPDRGRVIYGRHRRKLYRHPYGMTAAHAGRAHWTPVQYRGNKADSCGRTFVGSSCPAILELGKPF